jgi:hypothetical protein
MTPESQFRALLKRYKLQFNWSAEMNAWWLEGRAFNGQLWRSQYFRANYESDARASAIEYLNGFRKLER